METDKRRAVPLLFYLALALLVVLLGWTLFATYTIASPVRGRAGGGACRACCRAFLGAGRNRAYERQTVRQGAMNSLGVPRRRRRSPACDGESFKAKV